VRLFFWGGGEGEGGAKRVVAFFGRPDVVMSKKKKNFLPSRVKCKQWVNIGILRDQNASPEKIGGRSRRCFYHVMSSFCLVVEGDSRGVLIARVSCCSLRLTVTDHRSQRERIEWSSGTDVKDGRQSQVGGVLMLGCLLA
jgi:hypothetical protein